MRLLKLETWKRPPRVTPPRNEVFVYVNKDGELATLNHAGVVNTAVSDTLLPFRTKSFSFDTPELLVKSFDIIAVDLEAQTLTIAGAHAALFPVNSVFTIDQSTGNDTRSTPVIEIEEINETTVITTESLSDPTVDGRVNNSATAGVEIAPAGSAFIMSTLKTVEPFNGDMNPYFYLVERNDPTDSYGGTVRSDYSLASVDVQWSLQPFTQMRILEGPLVALVANDDRANPNSTVGEMTLLVGIL